jgi:Ca2+-binding EF-hand superfamily protein
MKKGRSKISYKEFVTGIEKLRINLHKNEIKLIFDYLDTDKDKFLNYTEFLKLNTNTNFTSRFPSNGDSQKNTSGLGT